METAVWIIAIVAVIIVVIIYVITSVGKYSDNFAGKIFKDKKKNEDKTKK